MFTVLDNALQKKVQKISDFIQDVFGITKFTTSKWFCIIGHVLYAGGIMYPPNFSIALVVIALLMLLIDLAIHVFSLEKQEKVFLVSGKLMLPSRGLINMTTITYRFAVFLVLTLLSTVVYVSFFVEQIIRIDGLMMNLGVLSHFIYLYLLICIPKGPKKSKLSLWIQKLTQAPAPASLTA